MVTFLPAVSYPPMAIITSVAGPADHVNNDAVIIRVLMGSESVHTGEISADVLGADLFISE